MDISFLGERRAYVSWWPPGTGDKTTNIVVGGPGRASTYADDKDIEGGDPHLTVEVDGLDEAKMFDLWAFWQHGDKYQFLFANCSTMVANLLNAGGGCLDYTCEMYFSHATSGSEYPGGLVGAIGSIFVGPVFTPKNVAEYARLINLNIDDIKARIAAGFTPDPHISHVRAFTRRMHL
jgi:hypothetical protein